MRELSSILLRLCLDLAGNAAASAIERLHAHAEEYLFTPEQRTAAKTAREQAAIDARCTRWVARAQERRVAS